MDGRKRAELDDIHKEFESGDPSQDENRRFTALDGVSVTFYPGELHVILGENGAGKSTLAHILSGLHRPSRGAIRLDGETLRFDSASDALRNGIAMVHQRPLLAAEASVLENILLGTPGVFLYRAKAARRLAEIKAAWEIKLSDNARVATLSPGDRFRTALLGALWRNPDYLILDEPSGVLAPNERDALFAALDRAKGRGLGVILITHRLEEALAHADRVSVLRRGRLAFSSAIRSGFVDAPGNSGNHGANCSSESTATVPLTYEFLAHAIDPDAPAATPIRMIEPAPLTAGAVIHGTERGTGAAQPALALDAISFESPEREGLKGVSFSAYPGTVTAIAGYPGSGLGTLEDILSGLLRPDSGTFSIRGTRVAGSRLTPAYLRSLGVACVPSDRAFRGSNPDITVGEMLTPYARMGFPRGIAAQTRAAKALLAREGIDAAPTRAVRTLSGGQLQRLILERELATDPAIVVLASPEWGLDVASIERLKEKIAELAASGKAVIVLTEETGSGGVCAPTRVLRDGILS
jgi:simple sugar transport system ATP-binding protein